jgi:VanZ family protein
MSSLLRKLLTIASNNFLQTLPKQRFRVILVWVVTVAWAAQIFRFSTQIFGSTLTTWLLSNILHLLHLTVSLPTFVLLHHLMRKCAHLTEYAIFSMLLYHSLTESPRVEWQRRMAFWAIGIAAVYSLTDEFHQLFVPGRGPSLVDSGIDTVGACLGILIIYAASRWARNKNSSTEDRTEVMVGK